MEARKRVAVAVDRGYGYGRDVASGVIHYFRHDPSWYIEWVEPRPDQMALMWTVPPKGVVVQASQPRVVQLLRGLAVPVVNVSNQIPELPWPRVGVKDREVGRMAAEHFLTAHFRHFAFCGLRSTVRFSNERRIGFETRLAEAGHRIDIYEDAAPDATTRWHRMREWFMALPKPVAVMAANDLRGYRATQVCLQCGYRIPEDVAILGVDNDESMCDWAEPALSSIPTSGREIGMTAGRLLDEMMQGRTVDPGPHLVSPAPPIKRGSTDVLAVEDQDLAQALRYIREHADEGIGVQDLLRQVPVSRRTLHRKFRDILGRSPYREIQRVRMERVKTLLVETDMPIMEVAERTGFYSSEHLATLFRRHSGVSPSEYRKQDRAAVEQ